MLKFRVWMSLGGLALDVLGCLQIMFFTLFELLVNYCNDLCLGSLDVMLNGLF